MVDSSVSQNMEHCLTSLPCRCSALVYFCFFYSRVRTLCATWMLGGCCHLLYERIAATMFVSSRPRHCKSLCQALRLPPAHLAINLFEVLYWCSLNKVLHLDNDLDWYHLLSNYWATNTLLKSCVPYRQLAGVNCSYLLDSQPAALSSRRVERTLTIVRWVWPSKCFFQSRVSRLVSVCSREIYE